MKTRFLIFLAAMLLGTASAFAQSGNNEPLKGDVNGDGKVDVADITAIVKIIMENGSGTDSYYTWYQGLASENQIQNQSYINGLSYNKTTKPTSTVGLSKGYNVFIFPSSWGTPTLYEDEAHTFRWSPYTSQELGITNPSGKNVLVWEAPNPATMFIVWPETYYWYVGTENPMNMSFITPIVNDNNSPGWRLIGNTLPIYSSSNKLLDITTNGSISLGGRVKYYIAVPSPNIKIYSTNGQDVTNASFNTLDPVTINNVTYTIYEYKNTAVNLGYDLY